MTLDIKCCWGWLDRPLFFGPQVRYRTFLHMELLQDNLALIVSVWKYNRGENKCISIYCRHYSSLSLYLYILKMQFKLYKGGGTYTCTCTCMYIYTAIRNKSSSQHLHNLSHKWQWQKMMLTTEKLGHRNDCNSYQETQNEKLH